MPNPSRITQLPLQPVETDGGSSLGLASLFFRHGCGSTVRTQSHLKWYSLCSYLPSFTLFGTFTSSVKGDECPKSRDKVPRWLCLSANPPAGIGITGRYKSQNRLQHLLGRAFLFLSDIKFTDLLCNYLNLTEQVTLCICSEYIILLSMRCSITHKVQGNCREGYSITMKLTRGVLSTQMNKSIYFSTLSLFTFMSSSLHCIYICHPKKQPAESKANPHLSQNFELRRQLQPSCSARRNKEWPDAFLCLSFFTSFNIQKLNYMGVGLVVLRNMFPPSQKQKRQSKTTE